jgi:ATP-dependent DNA ligase
VVEASVCKTDLSGFESRRYLQFTYNLMSGLVLFEFFEWTEADRLRHSKFVGLREDKEPKSVVKEYGDEA